MGEATNKSITPTSPSPSTFFDHEYLHTESKYTLVPKRSVDVQMGRLTEESEEGVTTVALTLV